ncbi:F510_1955 family glycosylhydrolase [Arthrobacter sp. B1805]|uniref:F510_1955 family glycosylhydrolase n=1 Tax=Arthrobacter sp. B1805 TaxID=2058892 RepID=UPI000CE5009E|nr:sialidase family protein [Arthrobacter sp. B1805]
MFSSLYRIAHFGPIAALAVLLSACATPASTSPDTPAASAAHYPSGHIHGMSVDPGTNRILLATHDGLFDVTRSPAQQIGPTIDLMGFTTTSDGTLYASGHPGPGTDLPDPVGLITSADDGRTWTPVSRQGETDFHALAATSDGLIGYEGQIITSPDGHHWTVAADDVPAYNLAAASSGTVLATTEEGLFRSEDSGATWGPVPDAPLLMLTTFAGDTAIGVTPDGTVHSSADAGPTWAERGTIEGEPAAIAAAHTNDDTHRVWVATDKGIHVSNDNGATFQPLTSQR